LSEYLGRFEGLRDSVLVMSIIGVGLMENLLLVRGFVDDILIVRLDIPGVHGEVRLERICNVVVRMYFLLLALS
jgi:hypothetical protein